MKKLRFAVIGCGRISGSHMRGLAYNFPDAELVALCDIVPEKMHTAEKKYQEYLSQFLSGMGEAGEKTSKHDICKYDDYHKILDREDIDIVNVATESGYHPQIAIDALNAGKHVIVEKPMALSIKDANAMIDTAKRNNRKLCVSFQNRFNIAIQKARSAFERERFGRMIHGVASIRWNRNDQYYNQADWRGTWELDGGTLMNQCTHNIDLLQWFLGEVDTVYAQTDTFLRSIEGEDMGAAVLRFKNKAIGIIEGTSCVYPTNLEETLNLFGEKGTVCIGGIAINHIENWKFGDGLDEEKEVIRNFGENPENVYGFGHIPLFKDMIDAVRTNRQPLVHGEEGKKALEIILAAYKSSKTGEPVKLPLEDFSTLDMRNK